MAIIKSIEKRNVVDEVYDQMKEFIINGDWEAGIKIPSENELAQLFGVSRNTVRSAIQKLKAIEVLTTRQGQGTFVCDSVVKNVVSSIVPIGHLSKEEIIDIMEFRRPLEIESAGLAAVRRSEEDVMSLEEAVNAMAGNIGDYRKYASADYQFHLCIAKACKNKMIYKVIVKMKDVIYAHFEEMGKDLGTQLSIENHKKLFEAIKSREPELARYIMKNSIELSINILKSR